MESQPGVQRCSDASTSLCASYPIATLLHLAMPRKARQSNPLGFEVVLRADYSSSSVVISSQSGASQLGLVMSPRHLGLGRRGARQPWYGRLFAQSNFFLHLLCSFRKFSDSRYEDVPTTGLENWTWFSGVVTWPFDWLLSLRPHGFDSQTYKAPDQGVCGTDR